ncbi:MAG: CDP-diacylglycerol--glycerol-3-phosphate 3-phosphatidyltransferase [Bacilli bacterium]|nr:CDP-diacylglycerol--glycerol-3-phosphate 3-phosphatidyltransferase [Bacilli bacterium]
MKINIPTRITIARIVLIVFLLIGLFVCWILNLATGWVSPTLGDSPISLVYFVSLLVFVIAAATDALDGYLARKWKQVTDLGKFLDPIADKLLVNSMLIFLCIPWGYAPGQIIIPVFCVILMVVRDLIVDALRFLAAKKDIVIAANIFGKLKTVAQMVAIPFVLMNSWPFLYFDQAWPNEARIANILIYLATVLSLLSGIIYVYQNRGVLKEGNLNPEAVELIAFCKEHGLTLGSVESMTAGAFGAEIASIPGASSVYRGGIITYSADIKVKLAGVEKALIEEKGVVSEEVAKSMASGGHEALEADIVISVTGNAGPTAEEGQAGVGEVYFGVFSSQGIAAIHKNFSGKRNEIRSMAAKEMVCLALNEAKKAVQNSDSMTNK